MDSPDDRDLQHRGSRNSRRRRTARSTPSSAASPSAWRRSRRAPTLKQLGDAGLLHEHDGVHRPRPRRSRRDRSSPPSTTRSPDLHAVRKIRRLSLEFFRKDYATPMQASFSISASMGRRQYHEDLSRMTPCRPGLLPQTLMAPVVRGSRASSLLSVLMVTADRRDRRLPARHRRHRWSPRSTTGWAPSPTPKRKALDRWIDEQQPQPGLHRRRCPASATTRASSSTRQRTPRVEPRPRTICDLSWRHSLPRPLTPRRSTSRPSTGRSACRRSPNTKASSVSDQAVLRDRLVTYDRPERLSLVADEPADHHRRDAALRPGRRRRRVAVSHAEYLASSASTGSSSSGPGSARRGRPTSLAPTDGSSRA